MFNNATLFNSDLSSWAVSEGTHFVSLELASVLFPFLFYLYLTPLLLNLS